MHFKWSRKREITRLPVPVAAVCRIRQALLQRHRRLFHLVNRAALLIARALEYPTAAAAMGRLPCGISRKSPICRTLLRGLVADIMRATRPARVN